MIVNEIYEVMNKKFLENLVRKEINKVDPIGLISMGAPNDEYDSEVEEITLKITTCKNGKDLQELIYKTFIKMFDARLAGSRKIYQKLSARIFKSLNPA